DAATLQKVAYAACAYRCQYRSAEQRTGDRPRRRSADGGAARHRATDDRQYDLRRVWPAPGFNNVHAPEPVPRRDGSRSAFLAESRCSEVHLCSRVWWKADTAERFCAVRPVNNSTFHQPPGTISIVDHFVQFSSRSVLGRSGCTDTAGGTR